MCGENSERTIIRAVKRGSSPRVRGKLRKLDGVQGPVMAHPRVCGENSSIRVIFSLKVGSSPRVRGKPVDRTVVPAGVGLIPACAGKTPPRSRTSSTSGAHPRVCGENIAWIVASAAAAGSSPRVRGKPVIGLLLLLGLGLIPACAGKTNVVPE